MSIITQNKRYLPHEITTKINAVLLYRKERDISFVCRRYHVSKASLMRWNKLYDGTRESLIPKSHKPNSSHPNSHTEEEIKMIQNLHRRNPNISVCEMYGKLRDRAYTRHIGSLYRVFVRLGYRKKVESTKKKSRHNGKYDTPTIPGVKWQMDVKYVPTVCYVGTYGDRFYQYTMIDEATRERFIYPYREQSGYSTVDFVKRAIAYFGYAPQIIQTDNGSEFCNIRKTDRIHAFDVFCMKNNIKHKKIRPRTPWHNGKVERSHKTDQVRFYNYLSFYSYEDLIAQMKAYLRRSNKIPMSVLGWSSPVQYRAMLEATLNC